MIIKKSDYIRIKEKNAEMKSMIDRLYGERLMNAHRDVLDMISRIDYFKDNRDEWLALAIEKCNTMIEELRKMWEDGYINEMTRDLYSRTFVCLKGTCERIRAAGN